jgi:hypothetical protein
LLHRALLQRGAIPRFVGIKIMIAPRLACGSAGCDRSLDGENGCRTIAHSEGILRCDLANLQYYLDCAFLQMLDLSQSAHRLPSLRSPDGAFGAACTSRTGSSSSLTSTGGPGAASLATGGCLPTRVHATFDPAARMQTLLTRVCIYLALLDEQRLSHFQDQNQASPELLRSSRSRPSQVRRKID